MNPPTSTLNIRGVDYAVYDSGGHDPAVLLFHGWPDDATIWRRVTPHLNTAGYRTIAVDWPHHGASGTPQVSRCAAPELAADTVELVEQLELDTPHLVAHDYGATVSWETVLSYPDHFASYTAVSVGHSAAILPDLLRHPLRYRWLVTHGLQWSADRYLSSASRFERAFGSHPDRETVRTRMQSGDRTFWTIWERANPAPAVARRTLGPTSARRRVTIPTLGIYSLQDEWMTEKQMRRSARWVDAPWTYHRVDGGHWIPLEKPDLVARLLVDHLDAVGT